MDSGDYDCAFGICKCDLCEMFDEVNNVKMQPYMVVVKVANLDIHMELDTGAACSTISEVAYRKHLSDCTSHEF